MINLKIYINLYEYIKAIDLLCSNNSYEVSFLPLVLRIDYQEIYIYLKKKILKSNLEKLESTPMLNKLWSKIQTLLTF